MARYKLGSSTKQKLNYLTFKKINKNTIISIIKNILPNNPIFFNEQKQFLYHNENEMLDIFLDPTLVLLYYEHKGTYHIVFKKNVLTINIEIYENNREELFQRIKEFLL